MKDRSEQVGEYVGLLLGNIWLGFQIWAIVIMVQMVNTSWGTGWAWASGILFPFTLAFGPIVAAFAGEWRPFLIVYGVSALLSSSHMFLGWLASRGTTASSAADQ